MRETGTFGSLELSDELTELPSNLLLVIGSTLDHLKYQRSECFAFLSTGHNKVIVPFRCDRNERKRETAPLFGIADRWGLRADLANRHSGNDDMSEK